MATRDRYSPELDRIGFIRSTALGTSAMLFGAAGKAAKSAEVRSVLSADLAAAGDLAAAIEELEPAATDYRQRQDRARCGSRHPILG